MPGLLWMHGRPLGAKYAAIERLILRNATRSDHLGRCILAVRVLNMRQRPPRVDYLILALLLAPPWLSGVERFIDALERSDELVVWVLSVSGVVLVRNEFLEMFLVSIWDWWLFQGFGWRASLFLNEDAICARTLNWRKLAGGSSTTSFTAETGAHHGASAHMVSTRTLWGHRRGGGDFDLSKGGVGVL